MRTTDVVVGVDGSEAGWDALYWAVAEASRRQGSLHVVTVFTSWPDGMSMAGADPGSPGERSLAMKLSKMLGEARLLEPDVPVTGEIIRGGVAPALCEASLHSRLLVVGNRGHGGFGRLALGSTGQQVAAYASVPVVVVRGRIGTASSPIVVGIDGSAGSDSALSVAYEEARLRRCPLIVVFAYGRPRNPWAEWGDLPDPGPTHVLAYGSVDSALAPWRDKYPDVSVEITTTNAEPQRALADLSRHAQLVAVGAHGHGDSVGQLGSVPLRLLHRSHCPVLIGR